MGEEQVDTDNEFVWALTIATEGFDARQKC